MAAAAATIPHYSILDPHVHVWKHDAQFPFAAGAKVPEYDATPEALLALMKQNGIRKTVIIQVIHYRYDNSYLAAVLRQYPQYFLGVCRVDPIDPAHRTTSPRARASTTSPFWMKRTPTAWPFSTIEADPGRFPAEEMARMGPVLAVAVGLGLRKPGDKPS